jgi:hypothetical protein
MFDFRDEDRWRKYYKQILRMPSQKYGEKGCFVAALYIWEAWVHSRDLYEVMYA